MIDVCVQNFRFWLIFLQSFAVLLYCPSVYSVAWAFNLHLFFFVSIQYLFLSLVFWNSKRVYLGGSFFIHFVEPVVWTPVSCFSSGSCLVLCLWYFLSSVFSVLSFWEPTSQMLYLLAQSSKSAIISFIIPLSLVCLGVVYILRNFLNFIFCVSFC